MKALFLCLLIASLVVSGCSTTKEDIITYEKEGKVNKITDVLIDLKKSKGTVEEVHIEATKALIRLSKNNKQASDFAETEFKNFINIKELTELVAPIVIVEDIISFDTNNIATLRVSIQDAQFHMPKNETILKNKLNDLETKYSNLDKIKEKYGRDIEDINKKITEAKNADRDIPFAQVVVMKMFQALVKDLNIDYARLSLFTPEVQDRIICSTAKMYINNPQVKVDYDLYTGAKKTLKDLNDLKNELKTLYEEQQALEYVYKRQVLTIENNIKASVNALRNECIRKKKQDKEISSTSFNNKSSTDKSTRITNSVDQKNTNINNANPKQSSVIPKNIGNEIHENITFVEYTYFGEITGYSTKGEKSADNWVVTNNSIDPKICSPQWVFSTDAKTGKKSKVGSLVFSFSYHDSMNTKFRKTLELKTSEGVIIKKSTNNYNIKPIGKHYLIKISDGGSLYLNTQSFGFDLYKISRNRHVEKIMDCPRFLQYVKGDADFNQHNFRLADSKVVINKSSIDIFYKHLHSESFNHCISIILDPYDKRFVIKKVN